MVDEPVLSALTGLMGRCRPLAFSYELREFLISAHGALVVAVAGRYGIVGCRLTGWLYWHACTLLLWLSRRGDAYAVALLSHAEIRLRCQGRW